MSILRFRGVDSRALGTVELIHRGILCSLGISWRITARLKIPLFLKLREPQAGTSLIANLHRLAEATLGVKQAVEGEEVNGDSKRLNRDLDNRANNNPVLLLADEIVVNRILEKCLACIILASPAPEIFILVVAARALHDADSDGPDDDGEDEDTTGEDCCAESHAFGAGVTASPVTKHDREGKDERDRGDDEDTDLRPLRSVDSPWAEIITGCEVSSGEEDGEGGGDEGEDNEGTSTVDGAEEDLCETDLEFDGLKRMLARFMRRKKDNYLPNPCGPQQSPSLQVPLLVPLPLLFPGSLEDQQKEEQRDTGSGLLVMPAILACKECMGSALGMELLQLLHSPRPLTSAGSC